jgi:hypothetical protein
VAAENPGEEGWMAYEEFSIHIHGILRKENRAHKYIICQIQSLPCTTSYWRVRRAWKIASRKEATVHMTKTPSQFGRLGDGQEILSHKKFELS